MTNRKDYTWKCTAASAERMKSKKRELQEEVEEIRRTAWAKAAINRRYGDSLSGLYGRTMTNTNSNDLKRIVKNIEIKWTGREMDGDEPLHVVTGFENHDDLDLLTHPSPKIDGSYIHGVYEDRPVECAHCESNVQPDSDDRIDREDETYCGIVCLNDELNG